jgi:hypothetical protein
MLTFKALAAILAYSSALVRFFSESQVFRDTSHAAFVPVANVRFPSRWVFGGYVSKVDIVRNCFEMHPGAHSLKRSQPYDQQL